MSIVISLREPTTSLQSAISSTRASQAVYRDLHPTLNVAVVSESNSNADNSGNKKRFAHCKRRGHLCEKCFHWVDTPDGSKWVAKNPIEATKVKMLRAKAANRNKPRKVESVDVRSDETSDFGVLVMEKHALMSSNGSKKSDVVLDTGVTNRTFHDESMFISLSASNKTVMNGGQD